jgi:hypothetical protein
MGFLLNVHKGRRTPPMERCETCKYWDIDDTDDMGPLHYCLRKSPRHVAWDRGVPIRAWPATWPSDWCGKYQKRGEKDGTM